MEYPKIYLALDNCFALKRWVEPETWLPLIKDLGYTSIQASYDNEFDMLYNTKEYIDSWLERLTAAEKQYGAKVQSFYSGYQTYRTSGLAHPDSRVVNSIVDGWIKPAVKIAGERNVDMGFALHGIPENIMQAPEKYRECHEKLYRIYSDIGEYARKNGQVRVCVEAMYSPHHTPWTIEGTKEFLKNIYSLEGNAIYTTVDIGHMTGQRKFRKPEKEAIEKSLFDHPIKGYCPLWLGSDSAYAIWDDAAAGKMDKKQAVINILEEMKKYSYQFSIDERDSDLYAWVEELACYSPIMHIQQTDGITSPHSPFTKKNNEKGIVEGKKLLEAIATSYEKEEKGMPPKTDKIVMALELFASNTEHPHEIKNNMRETREYWKQYIPEDGIRLDQLLERL